MAGYYFRLPTWEELTPAQRAAINDPEQIALSGGPGTGKSVVSMWRHIFNYEQHHRSLLLTYTTTLERYLEACCRGKSASAAQQVGTSLRNRSFIQYQAYSEVIIDEAQDLDNEYFEDICSPVSYGADNSQILYPDHSSTEEELSNIFPGNAQHVLQKNFRCTKEIMLFAKQVFDEAAISYSMINRIDKTGDKPTLIVGSWDRYDSTPQAEVDSIVEIINDLRTDAENIAVLLPWKSTVKNYVSALEEEIDDFSYYYEDDSQFPSGCPPLKNVHITTFKSAKGLEFDTVIIPDFNKMDSVVGRYNVDWQDYYVGCTRARNNLYLLSNSNMPILNQVVDIEHI